MNYYFVNRAGERLLIGRSYAGWNFLLNVIPKKRLFVWEDWEQLLLTPGGIVEEEGPWLTRAYLRDVVTNRSCSELWENRSWAPYAYPDGGEKAFHAAFRSERGDKGLLRLADGICSFLLLNGEATWDAVLNLESITLGTYWWISAPKTPYLKEI